MDHFSSLYYSLFYHSECVTKGSIYSFYAPRNWHVNAIDPVYAMHAVGYIKFLTYYLKRLGELE